MPRESSPQPCRAGSSRLNDQDHGTIDVSHVSELNAHAREVLVVKERKQSRPSKKHKKKKKKKKKWPRFLNFFSRKSRKKSPKPSRKKSSKSSRKSSKRRSSLRRCPRRKRSTTTTESESPVHPFRECDCKEPPPPQQQPVTAPAPDAPPSPMRKSSYWTQTTSSIGQMPPRQAPRGSQTTPSLYQQAPSQAPQWTQTSTSVFQPPQPAPLPPPPEEYYYPLASGGPHPTQRVSVATSITRCDPVRCCTRDEATDTREMESDQYQTCPGVGSSSTYLVVPVRRRAGEDEAIRRAALDMARAVAASRAIVVQGTGNAPPPSPKPIPLQSAPRSQQPNSPPGAYPPPHPEEPVPRMFGYQPSRPDDFVKCSSPLFQSWMRNNMPFPYKSGGGCCKGAQALDGAIKGDVVPEVPSTPPTSPTNFVVNVRLTT